MKYVVLTAKHHDGFCLFDTKQTDYNIMHTPFRRDADQGTGRGVPEGRDSIWHVLFDLRLAPSGLPPRLRTGQASGKPHPNRNATKYLRKQVAELIGNYGPLATLWFDLPQ